MFKSRNHFSEVYKNQPATGHKSSIYKINREENDNESEDCYSEENNYRIDNS